MRIPWFLATSNNAQVYRCWSEREQNLTLGIFYVHVLRMYCIMVALIPFIARHVSVRLSVNAPYFAAVSVTNTTEHCTRYSKTDSTSDSRILFV